MDGCGSQAWLVTALMALLVLAGSGHPGSRNCTSEASDIQPHPDEPELSHPQLPLLPDKESPATSEIAADPPLLPDARPRSAYEVELQNLRSRVDLTGFTAVIEPPYIVIGDEPPERVRHRATHTVRWAVERLRQEYFRKEPLDILTIWLFKDEHSYRENVPRLFHHVPHTPFGYYAHEHKALIMNIATGGGTLVHELVHPFIEADFPDCPPWLNEGLGSLYEQSSERNGRIVGLTNWRLAGLQNAIREDRTIPLERLLTLAADEFYNGDQGLHYAQARYLCLHLQENELLRSYYHKFRERATTDPTGHGTLLDVLGQKDLEEFEAQWKAFVLDLRFP